MFPIFKKTKTIMFSKVFTLELVLKHVWIEALRLLNL